MNTDVTIIIPTHFRHRHLVRAMELYAAIDTPIIVADSTDTPYPSTDLPPNVTYFHWPEKGFIDKLQTAIRQVETDLVVMRADNRHILPTALGQCADFLSANPDYSLCHGAYASVRRHKDFLYAHPCYDEDGHQGLNGSTPTERTREVWDAYVPAFYAVSRTGNWERTLDIASRGIANFNALEVLNALLMAIAGKSKRLPIFYCANQIADRVSGKSASYDGFDVFARDEKYADELSHFMIEAASWLTEVESISRDEADEVIRNSIAHHLAMCCAHRPRRTFIQKLPKYFNRAMSIFDMNKDKRFLDEHKTAMDAYLAPLSKESVAEYSALMNWLDTWKDEI